MPKNPTGNRPTPSVAMPKGSNRWAMGSGGTGRNYNGSRGTKTPTGNRPVPSVAANTPPKAKSKNAVRPAATLYPMPKSRSNTGSKPRALGG